MKYKDISSRTKILLNIREGDFQNKATAKKKHRQKTKTCQLLQQKAKLFCLTEKINEKDLVGIDKKATRSPSILQFSERFHIFTCYFLGRILFTLHPPGGLHNFWTDLFLQFQFLPGKRGKFTNISSFCDNELFHFYNKMFFFEARTFTNFLHFCFPLQSEKQHTRKRF